MTDSWSWADHFEADGPYFATATCGLPPRETSAAMSEVLEDWRRGRVDAVGFDPVIAQARQLYARLTGVDVATVAVGHRSPRSSVSLRLDAGWGRDPHCHG